MNLQRIMASEKSYSQKVIYTVWFHLFSIFEVTKIIEIENRVVTAKGYGRSRGRKEFSVAIKEQQDESLWC